MLDIEGIVLQKVLNTKDLDSFSKLRSHFFDGKYAEIFRHSYKYYMKYGDVPSFIELELSISKQPLAQKSLYALKELEAPDVPIDLAIDALIDNYVQHSCLNKISNLVSNITKYDSNEIQQNIGNILLELDSELNTNETIIYADQLKVFKEEEVISSITVPTGLSNWYDSEVGGFYLEDLVLIGGYRGSGKSAVCANLVANQYLQGNVSAYFTIEMTGQETFDRIMAILANVKALDIKSGKLTLDEELKLINARTDMFQNAEHIKNSYMEHKDRLKFERELVNNASLKPDNQIVIVDDRELSLASIDFSLQKLKAKHGDKLKLVAIDYLNQIVMGSPNSDMYDWTNQILISKALKNMARKYKMTIISPYQVDEGGVARFAKGILDACDTAIILNRSGEENLVFNCSKARSTKSSFSFKVGVNWDTLTIDPTEIPNEAPPEEEDKPSKKKRKPAFTDDDI